MHIIFGISDKFSVLFYVCIAALGAVFVILSAILLPIESAIVLPIELPVTSAIVWIALFEAVLSASVVTLVAHGFLTLSRSSWATLVACVAPYLPPKF